MYVIFLYHCFIKIILSVYLGERQLSLKRKKNKMAEQANTPIEIIENLEVRNEPIINLRDVYNQRIKRLCYREIGSSYLRLDRGELCLSSATLSYDLMISVITMLNHVLHIQFIIDYETADWYSVCYYTLLTLVGYTSIDFGRLVFRELFAPLMLRNRTFLQDLAFHHTERNYLAWMPNFFANMAINNLDVDTFSITTEHGKTEYEFVLPEYPFKKLRVWGHIAEHLVQNQRIQLKEFCLYPTIYNPYLFRGEITLSLCNLHQLTTLCIPFSNVGDLDLSQICTNLIVLEKLDVSGCTLLTSAGMRCLRSLVNSTHLSVAYVDVKYEHLQVLGNLIYLDVSFQNFVALRILELMSCLPRLEMLLCVYSEPNYECLVEDLARTYLFLHRRNTPPIKVYGDHNIVQLLQRYKYDYYRIYGYSTFSVTTPSHIQEIASRYLSRSSFFRREGDRWVRNCFSVDEMLIPGERLVIEEEPI